MANPVHSGHRSAVTLIDFDMAATRAWLTDHDGEPDTNTWAEEIGCSDDTFMAVDLHPDPMVEPTYFVCVLEDLLRHAGDEADSGWNSNGLEIAVWRTADGEGPDGGCIITVDLPNKLRLASRHQTPSDFGPAPDVAPPDGSDRTGVEAALDALAHVAALIDGMVTTYRGAPLWPVDNWPIDTKVD